MGQVPIPEQIVVVREVNCVNWSGSTRVGFASSTPRYGVGGGVAWLPRENPGVVTRKGGWMLGRWKRQMSISVSYVILRHQDSEMTMLLRLGSYNHNSFFDTRCAKIIAKTFISFLSRPTSATHRVFCLPFSCPAGCFLLSSWSRWLFHAERRGFL